MKKSEELLELARKTLDIESAAITRLKSTIDEQFVECVRLIYASKGRIVVTGIGKSAIIGQKIVATLNSTGTPSIFMHAADAIHGDLGIIQKDDIIICISKSGNTPEVKVLIPLLRSWGNTLIAMVGNTDSYLALHSDYILNTTVDQEACPNNLAPTSSSMAQMAMGDVLAICLLDLRGFSSEDFARFHPGGALGKRLYLKVEDLYLSNSKPEVNIGEDLKKIIIEISSKRLGAAAVTENGKLVGIITDGDLRRMLLDNSADNIVTAAQIMSKNPKQVAKGTLAIDALHVMKEHNISQLLITEEDQYVGMIHLHDLIREGIL